MTLREIAERVVKGLNTAYQDEGYTIGAKFTDVDVIFLINGWVEERQRRIKMEWRVRHYRDVSGSWVLDAKLEKCCQNERHDWKDNDWHTQALRELGLADVELK